MNKARNEVKAIIPKVDLLIEVLDARIPYSSENPMIRELRGNTPALKLLAKSDLANPKLTEQWLTWHNQKRRDPGSGRIHQEPRRHQRNSGNAIRSAARRKTKP